MTDTAKNKDWKTFVDGYKDYLGAIQMFDLLSAERQQALIHSFKRDMKILLEAMEMGKK